MNSYSHSYELKAYWVTFHTLSSLYFIYHTSFISHTSFIHFTIQAIMTFFYFNIYSGLIHLILDSVEFNHWPLLGQCCKSFQQHHNDPTLIYRKSIWTNLFLISLVFLSWSFLIFILSFFFSSSYNSNFYSLNSFIFIQWLTLWGLLGECSHRWSHMPNYLLQNKVINLLQEYHFLLNPQYHHLHHQDPLHSTDFCELNKSCDFLFPLFFLKQSKINLLFLWLFFTFLPFFFLIGKKV